MPQFESAEIETEILIPLVKNLIFVHFVTPDLISFMLSFCKDMEFEELGKIAKMAHENPQQFKNAQISSQAVKLEHF